MIKKLYHNFYTFSDIEKADTSIAFDIDDYLFYKEETPDLQFVVNLSWKNLLNKNSINALDNILEKLHEKGVENKDIVVVVDKNNHRFTSKEWKLVKAWGKLIEERGVEFGFDDYNYTWSVEEVENANKKVNETVDIIRKSKTSPYESLLMAYLTVSSREYVEKEDADMAISRSVYGVMNNDDIVCVGFSEYLKAILEKVGCENIKVYTNSVALSPDNKEIDGFHANVVLYIKDEKYGIDGYYYLDPTWDCKYDNEHPNLLFFMVPIDDIKNIKSPYIRGDQSLPCNNGEDTVTDDIIYDERVENYLSFTSDQPVLSEEFINDYVKINPNIMQKLKSAYQARVFEEDYALMEKYSLILKTQKELLEMFDGAGITNITNDEAAKLMLALNTFSVDADVEKITKTCNNIVENYFLRQMGSEISALQSLAALTNKKQEWTATEILQKEVEVYEGRLKLVEERRAYTVSDENILKHLKNGDIMLTNVIYEEITQQSKPVHVGKTMNALRVGLTKLHPEISLKLIDKKVRDTISFNTKKVKRFFSKKASHPLLELSNLEKQ